ncbi:MAG: tetratricopeptide repeat protein [Acidobacteria bacterium]|nr:tetratricopeptide repeat protein [Acidobacteriota bacterium]
MRVASLLMILALAAPTRAADVEQQNRAEALAHYHAGEESMRAEHFEEAVAEFRSAVRLDPLFVLAHYSLGQAYMALKRYPDAVRAYVACREALEQLQAASLQDRARVERRRDDEIRELKDHVQGIRSGRIKSGNPEHAVLRLEERIRVLEDTRLRGADKEVRVPAELSLALGSAHFRQGQLAEAEREYLAAIGADRKLGAAHNNLAVVYMMTGRLAEAERHVKLAEKAGFRVHPKLKDDIEQAAAQAKP